MPRRGLPADYDWRYESLPTTQIVWEVIYRARPHQWLPSCRLALVRLEGTGRGRCGAWLLGGFLLCRWFRPRSGLLRTICQAASRVQRVASKAPSTVAGCAGSMTAREDAQREALALSFASLAEAVRGDSVVLKSLGGFSTEQLAFLFKDRAKKASEWLAQMAPVLSGFRSPAKLPGWSWCSGFLGGAG